MKKEKTKYDRVEFNLTEDRQGFTAFRYTYYLKEKCVDILIYSDCSHKRAAELAFKREMDKMEWIKP